MIFWILLFTQRNRRLLITDGNCEVELSSGRAVSVRLENTRPQKRGVWALVERFDVELKSDFSAKWLIKLSGARSLLYRPQIWQENMRWKARDEIYKIYMLLHRSDLNISENFRQTFSHFLAKICKVSLLNSFH